MPEISLSIRGHEAYCGVQKEVEGRRKEGFYQDCIAAFLHQN
jgi:hypothetical protein